MGKAGCRADTLSQRWRGAALAGDAGRCLAVWCNVGNGERAMPEPDVPVLIVGGGPAGLSAFLLLSRHGVRSLLVERHPGTSVHPKARGLNVRTMELFRVWGLEPAVRAAAAGLDRAVDVVWAPALTGPETRRVPYGGAGERLGTDSPTISAGCTQDALEPILLGAARSRGVGEARFGCELRALAQDDAGVTATITDHDSGREMTVRAGWVIGADGWQSLVRSMLGIAMAGPGRSGTGWASTSGPPAWPKSARAARPSCTGWDPRMPPR